MNDNQIKGLTSKEASSLLLQYGPNAVKLEGHKSPVLVFLATFKNPLIILLIAYFDCLV